MTATHREDIEGLERVGRLAAELLDRLAREARAGATTGDLDRSAERWLEGAGARSAPRAEYGFPGAVCLSVGEEVVHGIPGDRRLRPGDLLKIDVTVELDGFVADTARTVLIGAGSGEARRLIACSRAAFRAGLAAARVGGAVRAVGRAIEAETRRRGFRVVRALSGHGVGRRIHEDPEVPNFDDPRLEARFPEGSVVAIEPILCDGSGHVRTLADGWTIRTADRSLAVHHEHTVLVTCGGPRILTTIGRGRTAA